MLGSERFRRNERAAAIHSVGVLLDRRRKEQQEQHQKQNNNNWMMEDSSKQSSRMAPFGEENHHHGMPMPSLPAGKIKSSSILKGNSAKNAAPAYDLNNNKLLPPAMELYTSGKKEQKQQQFGAAKKGLRWKLEEELEEDKHKSAVQHQKQQDIVEEEHFQCCMVCGGRIWSNDEKSCMFGLGQEEEGKGELLVHWACFRCATCGLDLGSETEEEDSVFKREGRFYCQVHGPTALAAATGGNGQKQLGKKRELEAVSKLGRSIGQQQPEMMARVREEEKQEEKQKQEEMWWERQTDEFNGNKRSSITVRSYGGSRSGVDKQQQQQLNSLNSLNLKTEKPGNAKQWKHQQQQKQLPADENGGIASIDLKRFSNSSSRKIGGEAVDWKRKATTNGPEKYANDEKFKQSNDEKFKPSSVDRCEQCHVQLSGSFVLAKERAWCPEHFCCANPACARPLLESGFVEAESGTGTKRLNYCPKCYELLIAPICHKCSLPLNESCLNALGQKWHPDCFCCAHCRKPFGTRSFFVEAGKPYCDDDWNELFTSKCAECGEAIKVGQKWLEALGGRSFHADCFRCTTCRALLEGQTFFERQERPYCRVHACQQQQKGMNGTGRR